jgi:hypothetical protein
MKQLTVTRIAAAAALAILGFPPASVADDYDKKTIITISEPLEVPGIVLQPGKYVFKLLNSSSNRHIVEVMNERMDHLYALTFTAAANKVEQRGKTVLTYYESKGDQPQALKRWFWPGDLDGQEFLYPRKQAERISAASGVKVPEGPLPTSKEGDTKLIADNADKDDSTAAVVDSKSSDSSATAAAAVVAEPVPARVEEPRTVALNAQPAPEPAPVPQVTPAPVQPAEPVTQPVTQPATTAVVSTPDTDTLPQTASQLPLIAALAAVSLFLATITGVYARRRS